MSPHVRLKKNRLPVTYSFSQGKAIASEGQAGRIKNIWCTVAGNRLTRPNCKKTFQLISQKFTARCELTSFKYSRATGWPGLLYLFLEKFRGQPADQTNCRLQTYNTIIPYIGPGTTIQSIRANQPTNLFPTFQQKHPIGKKTINLPLTEFCPHSLGHG